ncbi:metallophosphoesterase [Paenibacillus arenosi]|uniref:Metallophosphoesterase n=1 Tax=Paenibacillus arenosi TaxID=2774142 RepID=A0ABR9AZL1_9BACL|nr:metallophosphoesterase [Paenibacillus arenosi]MBD8499592.1 metallophosphoesterase [Paenibacillus arenosi]
MNVILITIFVVTLCYFVFIFPTQWLKVERIHYPCGLGIRALQISDLHVEKLRISPRKLNRIIKKEKPNYIFITGDFTEKAKYLPKVKRYFEAIASHQIPSYAVLGNHDHRLNTQELHVLINILEEVGITVLMNSSCDLDEFQIIGIDDYCSKKSRIDCAYENIDPRKPILVLTHDPNLVLHLNNNYSYLMSGHYHGMQFNIPFLFTLRIQGKLASEGIYKGLHIGQFGPYYISKGIGQAGLNARFLVRSEVTIHEL